MGFAVPANYQDTLRFLDGAHGIHSVHHQVEQNLLELHTIAGDARQVLGKISADRDEACNRLVTSQRQDIFDDIPQIQQ